MKYSPYPLQSKNRYIFFSMLCLIAAAILAVFGFGYHSRLFYENLNLISYLALITITILSLSSFLINVGRRFDFFEPIYFVSLLFIFVFFLRPLQILFDPSVRVRYLPNDLHYIETALIFGAIGLVSFLFGYNLKLGNVLGNKVSVLGNNWNKKRLVLVSFSYTIIGLIAYFFAIHQSGGVGLFFETLRGRRLLSGNWAIASFVQLVQISSLLLLAYYFKTRKLLFPALVCVLLSFVTSLFLGGRSIIIVYLFQPVVIYYYIRKFRTQKRLSFLVALIIISVFAVLIIVILGSMRVHIAKGGFLGDISSMPDIFLMGIVQRLIGEFTQFDWFAIILYLVPMAVPYHNGSTFLQFFYMFIPRAFWAEKPLPIAYTVNQMFTQSPNPSGTPFTILGELYLNFGILGIILGMILFGLFFKSIYCYFKNNNRNLASIIIYSYLFVNIHRLFTRSFAPKLFGIVIFLIPLIIAIMFIIHGPKREKKL